MSQFYVGITDTSWYSLLREDYRRLRNATARINTAFFVTKLK